MPYKKGVNMKSSKNIFFAVLLLAMLAGCGGQSEPSAGGDDAKPAADRKAPSTTIQLNSMPKADRSIPLDRYAEIQGGNEVMFLYYALAGIPVDHEKAVELYSSEYRLTSDGFKKRDILTALTPKIDEEILRAKSSRYVRQTVFDPNSMFRPIKSYDFERKGFPVSDGVASPGSYFTFSDNPHFKVEYTNGEAFSLFKLEDEAKAREIEEMIGRGERFSLVIYAFAQGAGVRENTVSAEIVSMKVLDKNGRELLTM